MDEIHSLIEKVLNEYKSKYELLGEGRNRMVFIKDEKWVIKVPLNQEGLEDQYQESDCYKKNKDEGIYAECILFHDQDIPILKMERVAPVHFNHGDKSKPVWVDFIDCGQVGYTSDGRLVAYDYGYN